MGGTGSRFAGGPPALAADRVQRCAERENPVRRAGHSFGVPIAATQIIIVPIIMHMRTDKFWDHE
jgi:hypothetical protein